MNVHRKALKIAYFDIYKLMTWKNRKLSLGSRWCLTRTRPSRPAAWAPTCSGSVNNGQRMRLHPFPGSLAFSEPCLISHAVPPLCERATCHTPVMATQDRGEDPALDTSWRHLPVSWLGGRVQFWQWSTILTKPNHISKNYLLNQNQNRSPMGTPWALGQHPGMTIYTSCVKTAEVQGMSPSRLPSSVGLPGLSGGRPGA